MEVPDRAFWGFLASSVPWIWETEGWNLGEEAEGTCACADTSVCGVR